MAVSAGKSPDSQKQGSEKTTSDKQSGGTATFQFVDNRAESVRHIQMQEAANHHANQQPIQQIASGKPVQLAKDAALWSAGDKVPGKTSTKVIMTKGGKKGIFRFPMNGDIIDTFIGQNEADESLKPAAHADAQKIDIPVAVPDHDLAAAYGDTEALSDGQITGGNRGTHFAHGDNSHGVDRSNKYTWHHKSTKGKMELIDMNVHGAMWHYGGIASWEASRHDSTVSEDDPSAE